MKKEFKNTDIKDVYSTLIQSKYKNNYEFERWFTTARLRLDYFMMTKTIQFHLAKVSFADCLEVGPGPGTWTRLLYRTNPKANFSLVDISKEMREQFELEMRSQDNVKYQLSDFLEFDSGKKYDLFFSSRAFEYVDDQLGFIKKLYSMMTADASGVLITKNPDHRASVKKSVQKRSHHTGQITPAALQSMLLEVGFVDVLVYPAIIRLPYIERFTSFFTNKLFRKVFHVPTDSLPFYAESYVVVFKKTS